MPNHGHADHSRRYLGALALVVLLLILLASAVGIASSLGEPPENAASASSSTTTTSTPLGTSPTTTATIATTTTQGTPNPTTTTTSTNSPATTTTTTTLPTSTTATSITLPTSTTSTTIALPTTTTTVPAPPARYETTFLLNDHSGSGLEGGVVAVLDGATWTILGVTDAEGNHTASLTEGLHTIRLSINGSSETRVVTIGEFSAATELDPPTTFTTGRVEIIFSGDIVYGATDELFENSVDLLPGSHEFVFSNESHPGLSATITVVSGDNVTRSAIYTTLRNATDAPISAANVSGWLTEPTGGRSWQTMGTTNASGALLYLHTGDTSGNTDVRTAAGAHGDETISQDPATDSFYDFQTSTGTIALAGHTGDPLAGGAVSVYANGEWHDLGHTDSSGILAIDSFNDAYSYAMEFNHTREQRDDVNPHSGLVTFQTGRFSVYFSGTVNWGPGSLYAYDGPQQVLPGDYYVTLGQPGWWAATTSLNVGPGDDIVKSGVVARLHSSSAAPIQGAEARISLAGWPIVGSTDEHGVAGTLFDGLLDRNRTVRMAYNGTTAAITHNPSTNSFYDFATLAATVRVVDSNSNPIPGLAVKQSAPGWPTIGTTNDQGEVSTEIFSGYKRSYRVTYNGTTATKAKKFTPKNNTLVFSTLAATVRVVDSTSNPIPGLAVKQSAPGWPTIGTTNDQGEVSTEIFSGYKRSYRVTYNGTTATKAKKFTHSKPTLTFQTVDATFRMIDSRNQPISGIAIKQSAPGWPTIGTTDATGEVHAELFAGYKRSYRVTHNGTTETKVKKFGKASTLVFKSIRAQFVVLDTDGSGIEGLDIRQSSPGWPTIGTTDSRGRAAYEVMRGYERNYRVTREGETQTKAKSFVPGDRKLSFTFDAAPEPAN